MSIIQSVIIIQKFIRRFLVKKHILIPSSYYQTKIWRKNREWYKNGKSNECEKYQINLIEKIISIKLSKTNDRINIETIKIIENRNPMINNDGYEWSENFDGKIIKNNKIYYFNLKFVCDFGGAQTRTLREVYYFIKYQIKYLVNSNTCDTYFINILDGNTCYNNMEKFMYLLNKKKYRCFTKYIFIGNLYEFQKSNIVLNIK